MAKRHKKRLSAKQVRLSVAAASSTRSAACVDRGGSADTCEARAIRAANGVTGMPPQSPQPLHSIVAHISAATTRREWLDGREYLVARVAPIVELR